MHAYEQGGDCSGFAPIYWQPLGLDARFLEGPLIYRSPLSVHAHEQGSEGSGFTATYWLP